MRTLSFKGFKSLTSSVSRMPIMSSSFNMTCFVPLNSTSVPEYLEYTTWAPVYIHKNRNHQQTNQQECFLAFQKLALKVVFKFNQAFNFRFRFLKPQENNEQSSGISSFIILSRTNNFNNWELNHVNEQLPSH